MLWQYVGLLAMHWLADFVCQTHWQASNKSKRNDALLRHVTNYTMILGAAAFAMFPGLLWLPLAFAIGNGLLHFATDYFTSRWSSKLYAKQALAQLLRGDRLRPTDPSMHAGRDALAGSELWLVIR